MSQVFHFTVIQEYNKYSLRGLQKHIQENSKISESLWCASHLNYQEFIRFSLGALSFECLAIVESLRVHHSYSRWNYYCSKPKKKVEWNLPQRKLLWSHKIFYCFPPSACSFFSLTATLVASSLVPLVSKGTIPFVSARNKS